MVSNVMQERHFATGIYLNPDKALNYLAYGEVYKSALKSLIAHFEKTDESIIPLVSPSTAQITT